MVTEIEKLKNEVGEGETIRDLGEIIGKDEWEIHEKPESVEKCIYCNADWSPEMMGLYIESGYCETCYDSEYLTVIACSKCGKVVYKK